MGILLEGALVISAFVLAGALMGYLYHERLMVRRHEVFVDRATVSGFLERKYGIDLTPDDWTEMTRHREPDSVPPMLNSYIAPREK